MKLESRQLLRAWILAILLIGLIGPIAMACRIPVFRYALERWAPDVFEITVNDDGRLNEQQQAALKKLQSVGLHQANVRWVPLQPDGEKAESAEQAAKEQKTPATDAHQMTVRLTRRGERTRHIWQAPLNLDNVENLLNSPQRQKISQRLLDGESAVWVLIESGNKEQDDLAAELLKTELAKMSEKLKLPDQSELEAEAEYNANISVELRIDFSMVRVSRKDPKEAAFLAMLLASESDLAEYDEPIVIPVYGRGRTYYALIGKGIRSELIAENCRFICGDCSCQVKEENPGSDLLFSVDWDAKVRGSAIPEKELPPLTGIGSLEIIDLGTVEDMQAEKQTRTKQPIAATDTTESKPAESETSTSDPKESATAVELETSPAATHKPAATTDDVAADPETAIGPDTSSGEITIDADAQEKLGHAPTDPPTNGSGDSTTQSVVSTDLNPSIPATNDPSVQPAADQQLAVNAEPAAEPTTTTRAHLMVEDTESITTEAEQTKSNMALILLAFTGIATVVVFVVGYLIRQ